MAQDYTDLFSLTPEKPRKNFVEVDPDLANAQALSAVSRTYGLKQPAVLPSKDTANVVKSSYEIPPALPEELGLPKENISDILNVSAARAMPNFAQAGTRPLSADYGAIGVGGNKAENEVFSGSRDRNAEFMPTKREKEAAPQTAPKPLTANTDPDFSSSIWSKLIVGLTPYALESFFGGGKWMGSAGQGSVAGIKTMDALEKQFADLREKQNLRKDKMSQFESTLENKKTQQDIENKLKRDQFNQPSYMKTEVVGASGKPELGAIDKKTAEVVHTGELLPPGKENEYAKYRQDMVNLAKEKASMGYQQQAQKDVESLPENKRIIEDTRIRISKSPEFWKNVTSPIANTEDAKQDKSAYDQMVNTSIFLRGGKTVTATEKALITGPTGAVAFGELDIEGLKNWLKSNPENAKRYFKNTEDLYNAKVRTARAANTTPSGVSYADKVAGTTLDLGAAPKPAPEIAEPMYHTLLTPQDKAAIEWAKGNPNDPRAVQIFKLHGMVK